MMRVFVLLLCLVGSTCWANSSIIKIKVEGNKVYWRNSLMVMGDKRAPSFWQHAQNITPTESWLAGSWTQTPPNSMTLNSGTDSVSLPVTVVGLEYNTGSISATTGRVSSLTGCGSQSLTGNQITLVGDRCYQMNWLDHSSSITPFAFTRPLFQLSDSQILTALSGKPAGVYFGLVQLTSVHRFMLNGVETQYFLPHTLAFEIEFFPSVIYSVQVSGDHRLTPVYQFEQQRVSAHTQLTVGVDGYFAQGLLLSLSPSKVHYQFTGPNSSVIPYSIECLQCLDRELVLNGAVVHSQTSVQTGSQNYIQFDLRVFFEQQDLQLIEAGEFWDTFSLILQPEV